MIGFIQATLLPDALRDWCGPVYVRYPLPTRPGDVERRHEFREYAYVDNVGLFPRMSSGPVRPEAWALNGIYLPCARMEVRARVVWALERGHPGRAPVSARWLLPADEGGDVQPSLAEHVACVLAYHAQCVGAGGRGVSGWLAPWDIRRDDTGKIIHVSRSPVARTHDGGAWYVQDAVANDHMARMDAYWMQCGLVLQNANGTLRLPPEGV